MYPPSSPSPYVPAKSLIPSSPSASGGITLNRARLTRGSSSERIGLVGLSGWRRRPKSNSKGTATGTTISNSAKTTTTTLGRSLSTSGVGSGKSRISTKRSRKGLGLGMGMEETPAKKKRLTVSSIGTKSTPKATSSNPHARSTDQPDANGPPVSSPLGYSELLLDSADEDESRPSHSIPAIRHIPPIQKSDEVFFVTDPARLIVDRSPSPTGDKDALIYERGGDALFPAAHDLFVPLNDISSSSASPLTPGSGDMINPGRTTIHEEDEDEDKSAAKPKRSKWDLTVPLNDLTQPSSPSTARKTTSKPTSKIKQRRSTPYKLPGASTVPPRPSNDENNSPDSVEMSRGVTTPTGRRYPPPPPLTGGANVDREGSPPPPILIHSQADDIIDDVDDGHRMLDIHLEIESSPAASNESGAGGSQQTDSSSEDSDEDPFGLMWMVQAVRDKEPCQWCPSSEFSSPIAPRTPSPIVFSATPSPAHSGAVSPAGKDNGSINQVKVTRPSRVSRSVWRGAEVLKRMDGEEAARPEAGSEGQESHDEEEGPALDRTKRQRQHDSRGKKTARTYRRVERSSTPEITEEALRARQARIQHYQDLQDRHPLTIEYVWW
ncbi:hypothetical protein CI109_101535 [Kwoniella shandongensis]|uniref:Uncharacterized protein n=1 Tax=Kwoniella shandongensis TaxID=1734106 RepID=A0A5M6CBQ8_9TREE|nr:uncharacterized protein CI109_001333 [Kwoniella shandongensis]KAA5530529.1 hypothetical protein CI109_001333 [Kwoniella shandongensis]